MLKKHFRKVPFHKKTTYFFFALASGLCFMVRTNNFRTDDVRPFSRTVSKNYESMTTLWVKPVNPSGLWNQPHNVINIGSTYQAPAYTNRKVPSKQRLVSPATVTKIHGTRKLILIEDMDESFLLM